MGIIVNGELFDMFCCVKCFGVLLVCIDICQESICYIEVLGEIICYFGIGDYESWLEVDKQVFLICELNFKCLLLLCNWELSNDICEVFEICKVIVEVLKGLIVVYVILMVKMLFDVLVVYLLLKEVGIGFVMLVVLLFEIFDDLNNVDDVMIQLLNIDWYCGLIQGKQMVMIGYFDLVKDVGVMVVLWVQYQVQDVLIKICEKVGIEFIFFYGCGGFIGCGGVLVYVVLFL